MKHRRIVSILAGFVSISGIALASPNCISVGSGSTTPPVVQIQYVNGCPGPIQFTVQWSGTNPPVTSIYWMTPNEKRWFKMLDVTAKVVSEGTPAFTGGTPGQVDVQQRHIVGVPGTDQVILHNHRQTHTLVQLEMTLYFKPPIVDGATDKPYVPKHVFMVVKPINLGDTHVMGFPLDVFDHYVVNSIKSEDEPGP